MSEDKKWKQIMIECPHCKKIVGVFGMWDDWWKKSIKVQRVSSVNASFAKKGSKLKKSGGGK